MAAVARRVESDSGGVVFGKKMGIVVQIRLFGAFAVSVGAEVVPERAWRLRKAKSLVKLLALAPEYRVHRERVTELLWPERAPAAAANNFHQALYVARRALEAAGADASAMLPLRDDMLELHPSGRVEVDVDVFEAAVAQARETRALPDYRAALGLYGGELLPEDRYEGWAVSRREALNEAHMGLLLELSARLDEAGDAPAAIGVLERAVVIDPLHEAAHRALMRLFAAAGRRQQALAQYHQLREALRRDLEAEPDPQTARLYRTLLRGEVDPHNPAQKLRLQTARPAGRPPAEPAPPHLPIAQTSFIDRHRELREVTRLLDRNRRLTLTGAGGSGKTRLGLEAAIGRVSACDGVWLVELAGLGDPQLAAAATASALGLALPAERPARESLSAQLAQGRVLLMLDNSEHLVSEAGRHADPRPVAAALADRHDQSAQTQEASSLNLTTDQAGYRLSETRSGRSPGQSSRSSATPPGRPSARRSAHSSITTTTPGHHGCRGPARWTNHGSHGYLVRQTTTDRTPPVPRVEVPVVTVQGRSA